MLQVLFRNADPGIPDCYKDAENLINQISSKIIKKENQTIDLETKRINAVKEIGKAYYTNLAKTANYTVILSDFTYFI